MIYTDEELRKLIREDIRDPEAMFEAIERDRPTRDRLLQLLEEEGKEVETFWPKWAPLSRAHPEKQDFAVWSKKPRLEDFLAAIESPAEDFRWVGELLPDLEKRISSGVVKTSPAIPLLRRLPALARQCWEIFDPLLWGIPQSVQLAAGVQTASRAWHPLGETWGADKFAVELLHNGEFSQLRLFVYNRQDAEPVPEITVLLSFDGSIEKSGTLGPAPDCPTMGSLLFEVGRLPALQKPEAALSLHCHRFRGEFTVPFHPWANPLACFRLLETYAHLAHWNHVIAYASSFWQAVATFLQEGAPYHQVYLLCNKTAEYLATAIRETEQGLSEDWHALQQALSHCIQILAQKTPSRPAVLDEMRDRLAAGPARSTRRGEAQSGRMLALFYSEELAQSGVSQDYGFLLPLRVQKRQNEPRFCSPCFAEPAIVQQLQDSFEAVGAYLREKGLTRLPTLESLYVDIPLPAPWGTPQLCFKDRSIGLAAAVAYFSYLLHPAYPEGHSPFAVPAAVAATGRVERTQGRVQSVQGISSKLSALCKELPESLAYIPEDHTQYPTAPGRVQRVATIASLFSHLFGQGEEPKYHQTLATAIERINRREGTIEKVLLYWTIPFTLRDPANLESVFQRIAELGIGGLAYRKDNAYLVLNLRENRQKRAAEIRREAWDEGLFSPSFLENYAVIEETRFTQNFKEERHWVRLELDPHSLTLKIQDLPEVETHAESKIPSAIEDFHAARRSLLLTLTGEGTAFFTLRTEFHPPSLERLLVYHQTSFRQGLQRAAYQRIKSLLPEVEVEMGEEPYLFSVVREMADSPREAQKVIEEDPPLFFALLSGALIEQFNPQAQNRLFGDNQSVRADVFMTVQNRQALLVEGQGHREQLTQAHIVANASENLVQAREIYNDINYLVWLELLLSLRQLLLCPSANRQAVERLYRRMRGPLVAKHKIPYQWWVDHWKGHLGIDDYYESWSSASVAGESKK